MKNITNLISASVESCLYARDERLVKARVLLMGASFSAIFMFSLSGAAHATAASDSGLTSYANSVSSKTNVIVDIISYLCYIGGAGLAALGVVDLKKHVENPQTPVKQGLAKLGFGGLLLALPFVTTIMQDTMGMKDKSGADFMIFDDKPTI